MSTGISVGATVPLSLGIGMSLHWPVIGRAIPFSLHTAVRAAAVIAPWHVFPQDRFTLIPLAIAAVYLVTALAIAIGIARLRSAK